MGFCTICLILWVFNTIFLIFYSYSPRGGKLKHWHIILWVTICLAFGNDLQAGKTVRTHSIGLLGGLSYYTGELNPHGHFRSPFIHPSFGILYRRSFHTRWAMRVNLMRATVSGDDALEITPLQATRGVNFRSNLYEASLVFEFNFYPFSANGDRSFPATPFIFAGVGAFYFNSKGTTEGNAGLLDLQSQQTEEKSYLPVSASIPFGMGFKFRFTDRIQASLEYGLRKTFTDYIDDVSTVYPVNKFQRGDSKNMDWYYIAAVSVTFRVGAKFTTCQWDNSGKGRKKGLLKKGY